MWISKRALLGKVFNQSPFKKMENDNLKQSLFSMFDVGTMLSHVKNLQNHENPTNTETKGNKE